MPAKEKEGETDVGRGEEEGESDSGADGGKGEGESDQQQTDVGAAGEEGEPLLTSAEGEGEKKRKGCSKDEVLAVLAHELGHWKCSHNLINLSIGEVRELLILSTPFVMLIPFIMTRSISFSLCLCLVSS